MKTAHELTVTAAATVLGVSRDRVLQFIWQNRIPARRVGPIYLLPAEAVEAFGRVERPVGNPNFGGRRPDGRTKVKAR